jgi:hypothetical protein
VPIPMGLSKEALDRLEQEDPEALAAYKRKRAADLDLRYPEPTLSDIEQLEADLSSEFSEYHAYADKISDLRYQRDETPAKWARFLEQGRRVRSRLTHNEILRVVSMVCRNPYNIHIPPSGPGEQRDVRAQKQARWANAFLAANERRSSRPLRRIVVDGAAEAGLAGWEIYLTDAYDKLDTDTYKEIHDERDGEHVVRTETDAEYMKRTEAELQSAGLPVCVRPVHRSALLMEKNDEGVERVIIRERKPYRQVYYKLQKKYASDNDKLEKLRLPKPGTRGWPVSSTSGGSQSRTISRMSYGSSADGDVETWRYYDARWYVYIVGGKIVEGPTEHNLPGVPFVPVEAIVTSSPNPAEQYEGITWGMGEIELALNDILTFGIDTQYTFNRPRPVVETEVGGKVLMDPRNPRTPARIDFSDPNRVPQLLPGQHIVDAYKDFNPKIAIELLQTLENLWQRSGRNPVAQGSSPGSDVAGYTVNSLMGAADDLYGILLDNDARAWGQVIDFVRQTIKYTIGNPVYLAVPGVGNRKGQTEWLALGPDDIDDTPCIVTIDPTSEANRLAKVNVYSQGWKDGVIPRRELQEKAYGAEDPERWDDEIIEEMTVQRVVGILIDSVIQRLLQAATPGMVPPPGGPEAGMPGAPPQQAGAPGASSLPPTPPTPPTVGAGQKAASQGNAGAPGAGNPAMMGSIAGQNNGFTPPPGMAQPTAAMGS